MQSANILQVNISGLTCDACYKLASKRLGSISGVEEVKIKNKEGLTEIIAGRQISREEIQNALAGTDYKIV